MRTYNERELIEIFHLLFLDQLGRKLDKRLYALKGGCNLRFFLNSIRYSEDMDIDVKIIAKQTLRNKINLILNALPFHQILRAKKIEITHIAEPKQTETTQRWKISFKTTSSQLPLHTKIEFSRRNLDDETLFEPISAHLLQAYGLMPIMANHYSPEKAFEQKIIALALRTQTQARDVFDLYHLLTANMTKLSNIKNIKTIRHIDTAKSNLFNISFEDFKSQVVAFLPHDYQKQYDSPDIWENIYNTINQSLGKISHATD